MAIPFPKNQTQTAPGTDRPRSPLDVAVDQVAEASREVLALVGQLGARLSPVLKPEPVNVDGTGGCEVQPAHSPLALELHNRAAFLRAVGDDLRGLLDRLEV